MRDYINIGSATYGEECVQVSKDGDYCQAMWIECKRFIEAIRAKLGPERGSAELGVKSFEHDYGTYYEVVCYFDDTDEEGLNYALECESDSPATWDDVGRRG